MRAWRAGDEFSLGRTREGFTGQVGFEGQRWKVWEEPVKWGNYTSKGWKVGLWRNNAEPFNWGRHVGDQPQETSRRDERSGNTTILEPAVSENIFLNQSVLTKGLPQGPGFWYLLSAKRLPIGKSWRTHSHFSREPDKVIYKDITKTRAQGKEGGSGRYGVKFLALGGLLTHWACFSVYAVGMRLPARRAGLKARIRGTIPRSPMWGYIRQGCQGCRRTLNGSRIQPCLIPLRLRRESAMTPFWF